MKRVAAILAGGASSRMGEDKAIKRLAGRRLIDLVYERLKPQADRILISAAGDYGLGVVVVADDLSMQKGPVGGVLSVARWCRARGIDRFATAPVDAPFLPIDLIERLSAAGRCAIARNAEGLHPTFALWDVEAFAEIGSGAAVASLKELSAACGAHVVDWDGALCFSNINTPQDLAAAEHALRTSAAP